MAYDCKRCGPMHIEETASGFRYLPAPTREQLNAAAEAALDALEKAMPVAGAERRKCERRK
jgi:hypothetical protein